MSNAYCSSRYITLCTNYLTLIELLLIELPFNTCNNHICVVYFSQCNLKGAAINDGKQPATSVILNENKNDIEVIKQSKSPTETMTVLKAIAIYMKNS